MLAEEAEVRSKIRQTVQGLGCPPYWREELEQEGIIHFWVIKTECPGQSESWYRRACCFHVRHEAERGRSIDSPRRRHLGCPLAEPGEEGDGEAEELEANTATPLEHCCARDLLQQLREQLDSLGRRILALLLEDHTAREIGAVVGLSRPTVLKHIRRIASTAVELGITRSE